MWAITNKLKFTNWDSYTEFCQCSQLTNFSRKRRQLIAAQLNQLLQVSNHKQIQIYIRESYMEFRQCSQSTNFFWKRSQLICAHLSISACEQSIHNQIQIRNFGDLGFILWVSSMQSVVQFLLEATSIDFYPTNQNYCNMWENKFKFTQFESHTSSSFNAVSWTISAGSDVNRLLYN